MKKIFLCFSVGVIVACNNSTDKPAAATTDKPAATAEKSKVDLPYTASYTSNWTTDVSDADLKTVLMSYKYWETADMAGIQSTLADTVTVEMSNGDHLVKSSGDLVKIWKNYRDSLSNVRFDIESWQKMYAPDKKDSYVVTWYKEFDTFKDGKVDSASYHDINQVKNGKISWYSQYKRKMK